MVHLTSLLALTVAIIYINYDAKRCSVFVTFRRQAKKKPLSDIKKRVFTECAHLGSNQGPKDYESIGLTNYKWGKYCVSDLQRPI
jgi:hypothetical protein